MALGSHWPHHLLRGLFRVVLSGGHTIAERSSCFENRSPELRAHPSGRRARARTAMLRLPQHHRPQQPAGVLVAAHTVPRWVYRSLPTEQEERRGMHLHASSSGSSSSSTGLNQESITASGLPVSTAAPALEKAAPSKAAAQASAPGEIEGTAGEAAGPGDEGGGSCPDWLQRTQLLVGDDGIGRLAGARVLLVGLGGVGSFAAEFLARAGVGHLTIVDGDSVDVTNKNRQLPALDSTVGLPKAEVCSRRLLDINPRLHLAALQEFLDPEKARNLVATGGTSGEAPPEGWQGFHYVVDCIDSIAPKKLLIHAAHSAGVRVVSSMGAGGRLDPSRVRVVDLFQTYNDPFALNIRKGLRRLGVTEGVVAVWSDEPVKLASLQLTDQQYKQSYYGTISYIPALFGLLIASHVIREVLGAPPKELLHVPDIQRGRSTSADRLAAAKRLARQQRRGQQPQRQRPAGEAAAGREGHVAELTDEQQQERRQQQQLRRQQQQQQSRKASRQGAAQEPKAVDATSSPSSISFPLADPSRTPEQAGSVDGPPERSAVIPAQGAALPGELFLYGTGI